MIKRKLSLYFGSISFKRSWQAIAVWFCFLKRSEKERRRLHALVKTTYCPKTSAVFSFGSGRSALAMCLKAAGIGAGDEVLLSAYTCLAVPTAVIAVGATPVYSDINEETLNTDADLMQAALSPRVKAMVIQHTLGKPVKGLSSLIQYARAKGVLVIEDCALALGSKQNGSYVGTLADATVLSMELSKTLSCGWGGLLLVNAPRLANEVSRRYETLTEPSWLSASRDLWQTVISSWCYQPLMPSFIAKYVIAAAFKSHFFRPSTPALEYEGQVLPHFLQKMGGFQATLARYQWGDFLSIAASCEKNAIALWKTLDAMNIRVPGVPALNEVAVTPRISLLVKDKGLITHYFKNAGIELGYWFDGPLSPMPSAVAFNYQIAHFPVAQKVALFVVNLPCHSRLTEKDVQHISNVLKAFITTYPDAILEPLSLTKMETISLEASLCVQ